MGFVTPHTLITNNPESLVEFYQDCRTNLISKQFAYRNLHRHGGPYSYQVYTTPVRRRDMAGYRSLRYGPAIFQAAVPKQFELRITVVGDRVFAARIDSQATRHTRDDCRHYDDPRIGYSSHSLPGHIAGLCLRLVHSFGLHYGAIDMIVTPEEEYIFLELNVNGEWGGVAHRAGLPVAEAIADWMVVDQELAHV